MNTLTQMTDIAKDVELIATNTLIPYTNNPKKHPPEQVKKIASSIKNYGWDQPIVVDGENEIIKGHGRLQAAEQLGLETVPVIQREDLTEAEAKAARIADNKTAESGWIDENLGVELEQLEATDPIDIDSLGFEDGELSDLLEAANGDSISEPADEVDLGLESEYEVIVECTDELHQEEVYNQLQEEGHKCRLNSL